MERKKELTLQVARYRFHWRVVSSLRLPAYAGSTLRGVFGRALKELACLINVPDCRGCTLLAACAYPPLFEPQNAARPAGAQKGSIPALSSYAIETPFSESSQYRPGDVYSFDMVLMTPAAVKQLPLITAAWQRAFSEGVGKGDGRAILEGVELLAPDGPPITLYSPEKKQIFRHEVDLSIPRFSNPTDITLHLETPLRIEQRGKLIRERDISPGIFLRHLIRRVSFHVCAQQAEAYSLAEIHQLNVLADSVSEGERCLVWADWSRYSSRQNQKMTLGGFVGSWQLLQVAPPLLPFIYLGQWLHVGKESAFGLGKYRCLL
ncbi:MAG: CRISPR system precrRNA processing endoribonuclease RAMP protein Cas6 [Alcaligenaceae bacterium]|nr:CRISPR system precrRNA processing endoribonuclease RAMP protein Cas6 [Alcaligenaceae bacterium]